MKTIWELLSEKFTPAQAAEIKQAAISFPGFSGSNIAPTGRPTMPAFQSNPFRNNAVISADPNNTGVIYIGLDQDVQSNWMIVLNAGDCVPLMTFKGAIFAYSPTPNQRFGFGEW